MGIIGVQLVFSLAVISFFQKLNKYFSLGQAILSRKIFQYLPPSNSDLKQEIEKYYQAQNARQPNKNNIQGKIKISNNLISSKVSEVFEIPQSPNYLQNVANHLQLSSLVATNLIILPFYTSFEWLFDFALITTSFINVICMTIYYGEYYYILYHPTQSNFNQLNNKYVDLTVIWNVLAILFAIKSLFQISLNYFGVFYTKTDFFATGKKKKNKFDGIIHDFSNETAKIDKKIKRPITQPSSFWATSKCLLQNYGPSAERALIYSACLIGLLLSLLVIFKRAQWFDVEFTPNFEDYIKNLTSTRGGFIPSLKTSNVIHNDNDINRTDSIIENATSSHSNRYEDYNSFISSASTSKRSINKVDSSGDVQFFRVLRYTLVYYASLIACSAVLAGLYLFPNLRWAHMFTDAIEYSSSVIQKSSLFLNFALPTILTILWFKPFVLYITKSIAFYFPDLIITPSHFYFGRLYLHIASALLKLCLLRPHLQAYLYLAYDKVLSLHNTITTNQNTTSNVGKPTPLTNKTIKLAVNRINVYLCVVCIQYIAPAIITLFLPCIILSLEFNPLTLQPLQKALTAYTTYTYSNEAYVSDNSTTRIHSVAGKNLNADIRNLSALWKYFTPNYSNNENISAMNNAMLPMLDNSIFKCPLIFMLLMNDILTSTFTIFGYLYRRSLTSQNTVA